MDTKSVYNIKTCYRMLYRFIVDNYKSFAEETQFDMFPNPKEGAFLNHVYRNGRVPILKHSALYGANGAGKSNLIEAMFFLRSFATIAYGDSKKNWYANNRFRLPASVKNRPICFAIEFEHLRKIYIYHVEFDAEGVRKEELSISVIAEGKMAKIFTRWYSNIEYKGIQVNDEIKVIIERQIKDHPHNSLLALNGMLHFIDNEDVRNAYSWIKDYFNVIKSEETIPSLLDMYMADEDMMAYVRKIFLDIDLGIKDLSVRQEDYDKWLKKGKGNDYMLSTILASTKNSQLAKMRAKVPEFIISEKDGVRLVSEFVFKQLGKDGYEGEMDVASQSVGTLRLLAIVPAIYSAMKEGKTIVIDEIDNSIHPILIKSLIRIFGKSDSNGQLIFSTHETALLNQHQLLRPDEVWFVEKTEGTTKIYSLNDFMRNKDITLENDYLDGRFGAIPFIGDLGIANV